MNTKSKKDITVIKGAKGCMGSRNKQNVVLATIAGLSQLKTPEEVARLRGKSVDEILA